jgi:uncharacterized membrane protein
VLGSDLGLLPVLADDAFGGRGEIVLQHRNLALERQHALPPALDPRPLELLVELGELELDADSVVFESWIRHGPGRTLHPLAGNASYAPRVRSAGFRVAIAAATGGAAGAAAAVVLPWQATVLTGWDVTASVFIVWVWISIATMESADTRAVAKSEDPEPLLADVLLLAASVGCLVGVGFAISKSHQLHGSPKGALVGLTVLSVVVSWAVVQTVFTLHYARIYYGEPDPDTGIDFNDPRQPAFSDFAYVAFTIGMTYQVSDTNLTSRTMRRTATAHALLSFLFGTFILAVTINVIASQL